jgi:protein-S-isoprenylcysteine O-methyltransferase Ste14
MADWLESIRQRLEERIYSYWEEYSMELFPRMEIGLFNGWLLITLFYLVFGIMLFIFPKIVVARLYDRSGQRGIHKGRRVFGMLFIFLWMFLSIVTPLTDDNAVLVLGIILYTLGLIGMVVALIDYKNTPIDQLVTSGLYSISRHPQQVTISASFLGVSVAMGSWLGLGLIVLGLILAHSKVLAEEEACLKQYGDSYKRYMERVPRYFLFF